MVFSNLQIVGIFTFNTLFNRSKIFSLLLSITICLACLSFIPLSYQDSGSANVIVPTVQNKVFRFDADVGHGKHFIIELPIDKLLFKPIVNVNKVAGVAKSVSINFVAIPENSNLYQQIGNDNLKTVFVYPIFTQAAYGENGFYYYYNKTCGSECLTVPIPDKIHASYSSSAKGSNVLLLLNYHFITDIDIDKNPDILKNYDRVIMMHNEYVTQKEYDAIIKHPNVVFLYPNALYAKVSVDYDKNTITLLRGHGYPDLGLRNGFDWKYDNSRFEYNFDCSNWNFSTRENYTFLNCYPEYRLLQDAELLRTLKKADPSNLLEDMSNWLTYPTQYNSTHTFLQDLDIDGKYIPLWVENPALWTINGQISRNDLADIIIYLHDKNMLS